MTAGHGIASGGGWGATGAQVIPRLQLVNAAPAVSYGCRLSLLFIFVFIYFFYFFSGSPPPYCNHNMCATLAHIISNTSSFLPVFFFTLGFQMCERRYPHAHLKVCRRQECVNQPFLTHYCLLVLALFKDVFGNNTHYQTHPRVLELVAMAGRIPGRWV